MKKYFIVVILGLFLGFLFAYTAYGQENYFTPGQTMRALQEREKSKVNDEQVNNTEVAEVTQNQKSQVTAEPIGTQDYYYKQFTYPFYVESGDFFETKYAVAFQNVNCYDVDFTLTYVQPYIVYSELEATVTSMSLLLGCIKQNIATVAETIDYCRLMGYEEEIELSLMYIIDVMYNQYTCIQDYALKYIDAYKEENFASCIKYMLEIEKIYWGFYVNPKGLIENPDGTN